MGKVDLMIDDDELLPGEAVFRAAEYEERIQALEDEIKRKERESQLAMEKMNQDHTKDYMFLQEEKKELQDQLAYFFQLLGKMAGNPDEISQMMGQLRVAVTGLRFFMHEISGAQLSVSGLPVIKKNVIMALRDWAKNFDHMKPQEDAADWLIKHFHVQGQVASYDKEFKPEKYRLKTKVSKELLPDYQVDVFKQLCDQTIQEMIEKTDREVAKAFLNDQIAKLAAPTDGGTTIEG